MFKYIKSLNGFSLIEIMIALSIFAFLIVIGNRFIIQGFRSITFTSEQETAVSNARRAMGIMIKEMRGANSSEYGAYALSAVEDQNYIYYSDIDKDGETEKVGYSLNDTVLEKIVIEPGELKDYSGVGITSTIANYINNKTDPIFTYYDSDYNATSIINDIRLINIKLKINVTPERIPQNYCAESDVQLRNLKDNL